MLGNVYIHACWNVQRKSKCGIKVQYQFTRFRCLMMQTLDGLACHNTHVMLWSRRLCADRQPWSPPTALCKWGVRRSHPRLSLIQRLCQPPDSKQSRRLAICEHAPQVHQLVFPTRLSGGQWLPVSNEAAASSLSTFMSAIPATSSSSVYSGSLS